MSKRHNAKLNLEYIKNEMKQINPSIKIIDDKYVNNKHGIKCECLICGHLWSPCWGSLRMGQGCPLCARNIKLDNMRLKYDDIKLRLYQLNPNIELISDTYTNAHSKLEVKCLIEGCGRVWSATWANLSQGYGCPSCSGRDVMTLDVAKEKLKQITKSITIIDDKYINNTHPLKVKCTVCGDEWYSYWSKLGYGVGCKKCAILNKIKPEDGKSFADIKQDSLVYLKNKELAYNYKPNSKCKLRFKCPDCGFEKDMIIGDFTAYGFSCDYCRDNKSIPEKIMRAVLLQLNIDFEMEKKFKWSDNKRYDFYIENINTIIEMHGAQHYKDIEFMGGDSVMRNDIIKRNLASKNKISNYIEVDCSDSKLESIKNNIITKLSNVINLSTVKWDDVFESSQNSLVKLSWDEWNNKSDDESVINICKRLKIGKTTFYRYIRKGIEIGICKPINKK